VISDGLIAAGFFMSIGFLSSNQVSILLKWLFTKFYDRQILLEFSQLKTVKFLPLLGWQQLISLGYDWIDN
jgi:hypothetical protein